MKLSLLSVLIAATLGGTIIITERPAYAYYESYCGVLVSAHSWCWGPYRDRIVWNRAQYPGSGTVRVGIMLYFNTFGTYHDRHFANNYVASRHSSGIPGQALSANGSDHRHTINGRMEVCPGCQPAIWSPDPDPATDAAQRAAIGKIGLLRRDAGVKDHLPGNFVDELQDAGFDVRASGARLARRDDHATYFVVPGSHVCLFRQSVGEGDAAGTCATLEQVDRGEAILISDSTPDLPKGFVRLTGIAPDGVTRAFVRSLSGGPDIEVPVENNVFIVEIPGTAEDVVASVAFVSRHTSDEVVQGESGEEPTDDGDHEAASGGCAAGGSQHPTLAMLALGWFAVVRRRRAAAAQLLMRPSVTTMRLMPMSTMVASICWRCRAGARADAWER